MKQIRHTKMSTIIRIALVFFAVIIAMPLSAQIDRGKMSFGPKLGYISRNESAIAGLTFDCALSNSFRLATSIGSAFRHEDLDAFIFDIDANFTVCNTGRWGFYPLVGITYNSWGRHDVDILASDDVSTHTNCLGLNAGAGIDIYCSKSLKLGFEAKYTLIRHFPNATAAFRLAYIF